jgi:hypothetical protein
MAKRLPIVALIALVTVVVTGARQAKEPVDAAVIGRIVAEGMNRSQAAGIFSMYVDTIGARLTSSPAHKRAAEWSRDMMTKWGLSNARLEPFEFGRGWTLEKQVIEMIEPRYMPLLGYAEAWSPSTPGEIVVPAVTVAGKTADEVSKLPELKGAAVLQQPMVTNFIATDRAQPTADPPPTPPTVFVQPGAAGGRQGTATPPAGRGGRRGAAPGGGLTVDQALRAGGAAVLLRPSRGMHGTVFLAGGRGENPDDKLPRIVLAGEHYNLIARLLQQRVPVKLRVDVQARLHDDRNTYNVLAEIPGTDPALRDQIVMLGAHLDSWHTGTGATDNADGSAVALEAFRILKAIGVQPRRTLRLALWSGEEQGLLGARAWVRANLEGDANRAAREKFNVYFNIDPGKGPIYGWYLQENDAVKPIFDAWLAPFVNKEFGAVKNVRPAVGSTDHVAFNGAGVPGFNPVQDFVDYDVRLHHTNADLYERVREQDLKQNAVIMASFVYHAAMRTEMLPSPVRK